MLVQIRWLRWRAGRAPRRGVPRSSLTATVFVAATARSYYLVGRKPATLRESQEVVEQAKTGRKEGLTTVVSHVFVAMAAALVAIWIYGRARPPAAVPQVPHSAAVTGVDGGAALPAADAIDPAQADAGQTETDAPAGDGGAKAAGSTVAAPSAQADAPVRIVADPPVLRVWHNTRVTLRAEAGEGRVFSRYVWHFEDGSDPAEGEVVAHVFPESVGARHVTLEAHDAAGKKLVVSRALPIERLDVAPLDGGELPVKKLPRRRGTRLLLVGTAHGPWLAHVRALMAGTADVAAVIATSSAVGRQLIGRPATSVPILVLRAAADPSAQPGPALVVLHDPDQRLKTLISGTARVPVVDGLALVSHDSTSDDHSEARLKRTFRAMQAASAYDKAVLLTARPLSPLVDDEPIAESGFRLYEQALRYKAKAVVSFSSRVAWDGRYGGLEAVAVGALDTGLCRRLKGHDDCQSPTVTVLDVPSRKRSRALHLRGPGLQTWLSASELPAEVGKYRR